MKTVWVTSRFEGWHHWPDAFEEVAYLRDRHRHEFHVRAEVPVDHANRSIEFITLKRQVVRFVAEAWPGGELGARSCEMVAEAIGRAIVREYGCAWARVDVSEDGENGGSCIVSIGEVTDADPALLINILGRE